MSPDVPWQRTTTVIWGCFLGYTWNNDSKWSAKPPKLLYDFYSIYIVYKCGRELETPALIKYYSHVV